MSLDLSSLLNLPTVETPLWRLEPGNDDIESLKETNETLRSALRALARKYLRTKKELDTAVDLLGYNKKPLPFLRLPREIRDQIYALALTAEKPIRIEPRALQSISLEDDRRKPATPGLLCLNKKSVKKQLRSSVPKAKFPSPTPANS